MQGVQPQSLSGKVVFTRATVGGAVLAAESYLFLKRV